MTDHEQLIEQLPLYAIGCLDRPERQALDVHLLSGCAACYGSLKQYYTVAALLPFALPTVEPPPGLKDRLLASLTVPAVPTTQRTPASQPLPSLPAVQNLNPPPPRTGLRLAVVMLVLAVTGLAVYAYMLRAQLLEAQASAHRVETALQEERRRLETLGREVAEQERAVAELKAAFADRTTDTGQLEQALTVSQQELEQSQRRLAQREQELVALRRSFAQRDEMLAILRSPGTQVFALTGTSRAQDAGGWVMYDPETKKALLYSYNLAAPPRGKVYQLWAIRDRPISAAIFVVDSGQKSRVLIRNGPDWSQAHGATVTLEPEGGRRQPSGEVYLATAP